MRYLPENHHPYFISAVLSCSSQCSLSNKMETFNSSSLTTKHQCPINISYFLSNHGQHCHTVTCINQASPKASLKPAQGLFQVPGITSAGTYILPLKTIYKYDTFNTKSDNKSPLSQHLLLTSSLAKYFISTWLYIVVNLLYRFLSYFEVLS